MAVTQPAEKTEEQRDGHERHKGGGVPNRAPVEISALLEDASPAIARKLIAKALEGDTKALLFCCERLFPLRRDFPVAFELPQIEGVGDALRASSLVLAHRADGKLSASEAAAIISLIATHVRMLEVVKFEERVAALEAEQAHEPASASRSPGAA